MKLSMMEKRNHFKDELAFLDGIVAGSWVERHSPQRAMKAVEGYIQTLPYRKWDKPMDIGGLHKYAVGIFNSLKVASNV